MTRADKPLTAQWVGAEGTLPFAVRSLLILAIVYTLYFTSSLLIPIAFAIFLNIALSPWVKRGARYGIPRPLTASVLVLTLLGIGVGGLLMFAEPAEEWLSAAPKSIRELKLEMMDAKGRFADIQELANEVEALATVADEASAPSVTIQGPGILEDAVGGLPFFLAGTAITLFLTFFLLAAGDDFLRRATLLGRTWKQRRNIVTIVRRIQSDLSMYFGTVAIINLFLGLAVSALLYLLGVENPLLWGAMVAVLNFIPYAGALVSLGVLLVVGLSEFESLARGLMVPGLFLLLTVVEGQLISPTILGKRLSLTPVTVFVSVMFWGWLWGIAGALMAVPIITSLRVIFNHSPKWQPVGVLIFGNRTQIS